MGEQLWAGWGMCLAYNCSKLAVLHWIAVGR